MVNGGGRHIGAIGDWERKARDLEAIAATRWRAAILLDVDVSNDVVTVKAAEPPHSNSFLAEGLGGFDAGGAVGGEHVCGGADDDEQEGDRSEGERVGWGDAEEERGDEAA